MIITCLSQSPGLQQVQAERPLRPARGEAGSTGQAPPCASRASGGDQDFLTALF